MFKTNEYFEGKVKSIAFESDKGSATIGVMAEGEYEFNTSTVEIMTVTSGSLNVLIADKDQWIIYKSGESFTVEANSSFKVKASPDTSYLCVYC